MIVQPYAFPSLLDTGFKGLSKREWFAGHALAALGKTVEVLPEGEVADICFSIADKMIAKSTEGQ
jgi:hypothetical protein